MSSLLTFVMGLFLLADGTHVGFANHLARFFWEGVGDKQKYHMVMSAVPRARVVWGYNKNKII
jgi:hypothetical protein